MYHYKTFAYITSVRSDQYAISMYNLCKIDMSLLYKYAINDIIHHRNLTTYIPSTTYA